MSDDLHEDLRNPNPFGIRSVVIRNIKRAAKNKYYTDRAIFEADIDKAIELLLNSKDESLLIFDKVTECHHDYTRFEYTVRRNMFGLYDHYERVCKDCGNIDSYSYHDEKEELPEWVQEAQSKNEFVKLYYNINI